MVLKMRLRSCAARSDLTWKLAFLVVSWILLNSCRSQPASVRPSIEFTGFLKQTRAAGRSTTSLKDAWPVLAPDS